MKSKTTHKPKIKFLQEIIKDTTAQHSENLLTVDDTDTGSKTNNITCHKFLDNTGKKQYQVPTIK